MVESVHCWWPGFGYVGVVLGDGLRGESGLEYSAGKQ